MPKEKPKYKISSNKKVRFPGNSQKSTLLDQKEKSFFDYLYFMVIHSTENKIIKLLQNKNIPFNLSFDENSKLILQILKSKDFNIANQIIQMSLQQLINDLLKQIYLEIKEKKQASYRGVVFKKAHLDPLIILIINSKCKTILQKNNIDTVKSRNTFYPKCFVEYHFYEFLEYLLRNERDRTSKEIVEHQIRRQKFLRDHDGESNFINIAKELERKLLIFSSSLFEGTVKNKIHIMKFIKKIGNLNNHILYILANPAQFTKKENLTLQLLQQTIFTIIEKINIHYKILPASSKYTEKGSSKRISLHKQVPMDNQINQRISQDNSKQGVKNAKTKGR